MRREDGLTGVGECTLMNQEAGVAAAAARLATLVAGEDARDRNRLARLLPHAPGGIVAHTALSAFEQALWDLAGQAAGEPIHRQFGGALRGTVSLYANVNPDQRAAYEGGLARIAAVREAVGPGVAVMVDAHWRFSAGGAARLVRDLAPLDPFWIECPVAACRRARGRTPPSTWVRRRASAPTRPYQSRRKPANPKPACRQATMICSRRPCPTGRGRTRSVTPRSADMLPTSSGFT